MSGTVQLGLGCSRFGSLVAGIDRAEARVLIAGALEMGVRDFDTANIYGQGDSERFLGEALRGVADARIITKAGQVFPWKKRAMIPFKSALKPLVRRIKGAEGAVANSRTAELPRNWSSAHLTISIERSLMRLRRSAVDVFLLHSPSVEILRRGEAMEALVDLKKAGKAIRIGVSVDDAEALAVALQDPRVEAVQFVQNPMHHADASTLSDARSRGVLLIGREILAGKRDAVGVAEALTFAAKQPVDIALLGTRHIVNLKQAHATITGA